MSSLWTSQYPDRHHSEVSFSARLPKDRLTLAELLSAQGVHTAGFVANAVAGAGFGFDRGFAEFHEVFRTLGSRGDVFRQVLPPWLAANRDRRFFAYLHFREPHFPYDPDPPFDTKFGPDGPIPKAARRDAAFFTDVNQGRRPFSQAEREHLVRLFDGNLAFADQEVGALRRAMEAEGLWDRTVVIVAADHGEELFERGWIGHNVHVYEPSVRVPLIVRFPKSAGLAGKRVAALADLLDVAPTIADIVGARGQGGSDREFQGRSLLPVVEGAPGKPAVLSRTVWDRPRYALRDERYKFLYYTQTGEEWLYDLEADPGETRDVAPDRAPAGGLLPAGPPRLDAAARPPRALGRGAGRALPRAVREPEVARLRPGRVPVKTGRQSSARVRSFCSTSARMLRGRGLSARARRRLSIARLWSTMISHSSRLPAMPFGRTTRRRFSPVSRVVHGRIHVEGWPVSLRRSVWTTRTGRTLPGSVPARGSRSAR